MTPGGVGSCVVHSSPVKPEGQLHGLASLAISAFLALEMQRMLVSCRQATAGHASVLEQEPIPLGETTTEGARIGTPRMALSPPPSPRPRAKAGVEATHETAPMESAPLAAAPSRSSAGRMRLVSGPGEEQHLATSRSQCLCIIC